jgi:NitT/TauT family transport system permease protein
MPESKVMGKERTRSLYRRLGSSIGWPLLAFTVLIVAWEIVIDVLKVPEFLVPAPSRFFARLVQSRDLFWTHSLVTGYEVILGFVAAAIISIPLALVIASVPIVERGVYPLIVFFQLIPKIAIAPLFIVWFGFTLFPKILLTFLLCFFPVLVDSMTGFKAIDPRLYYISRSMGASRWQTFRHIRLPAAMPFIFSGLKVSIVFAATGAIVGEFVGANEGLGYLLMRGTSYLDTPLIFAALVALSIMGLVFNYIVEGGEQLIMPWRRKREH